LQESVAPILKVLEDCCALKKLIQGIAFVSTACVQPPLPHQSCEKGCIPFLLESSHSSMTAKQVCDVHLRSVAAAMTKFLQDLHPHCRSNSHLFSKHILEHLLTEQCHDLPICIVRPSLICPSLDLQDGWKAKSPVLVFSTSVAHHCAFVAPRCEGKVNLVLVEDVTKDCIKAVFKLARPASEDGNGRLWYPVLSSTLTPPSTTTFLASMMKAIAPHAPRIGVRKNGCSNWCARQSSLLQGLLVGKGPPESSRLRTVFTTVSMQTRGILKAGTWNKHRRF
jgi:hypothetical protein